MTNILFNEGNVNKIMAVDLYNKSRKPVKTICIPQLHQASESSSPVQFDDFGFPIVKAE